MSARAAYEFHLKNWSDIQDHLPMLREAARGNVLEIGVRSGVSTSALLTGLEEHGGCLLSIDINDCPVFAGHPQWTFMKQDSRSAVLGDAYDVVFIDGDHTYEGALADLENFGAKAKRIFVHDTDCPDTFPGVRKAVEQFVKETGRRVTWHHGSYGMAEIV